MAVTINASTTAGLVNSADTSGILQLQTANTTALTIDASQNVGLGVTPPATASTNYKGFWLQNGCNINSFGGNSTPAMYLQTNGFFNGTNTVYSVSSFGYTNYGMANGSFQWYTAPAGTAGGTVTSTEVMTLNNSGRLGIGNTSPAVKLDVIGGSLYDGNFYLNSQFRNQAAASEKGILLGYNNADTSSIIASAYASGAGALAFWTHNNSTWGERARIDSSGNLLVGTTSSATGARLSVVQTTSNVITANIQSTASSPAYCMDLQTSGSAAGGGTFLRGFASGPTQTLNISNNGNITNTNNSYGAISDVKLKENIVDATPKLANLMQVKVRNYNMIGDTTKQIGVVAQELETVFPAMVDESIDSDKEGNDLGTTTKSVKYSVFVPMLIKAIQEQQAIIESLTQRITALEGAQA